MRALVISDTHFGAWTGDDLLAHPEYRERLAPHLDGVDEVIVLGDLFDFLFGRLADGFARAEGLVALLGHRLAGRRLVFVPGNHDHHLVVQAAEDALERRLVEGDDAAAAGDEMPAEWAFVRAYLERRLEGVEIEIAYPSYRFGDVLLAHGHYLDPHARRSGSAGSRLLTTALWSIAAGGRDDPRTPADYESTTTLLTEVLFTIAQLPHGTAAQRGVYGLAQSATRFTARASESVRWIDAVARRSTGRSETAGGGGGSPPDDEAAARMLDPSNLERARRREHLRRRRQGAPAGYTSPGPILARTQRPSDPRERALEAFAESVARLGWDREAQTIVFAHTHQPLAAVTAERTGPSVRYWNTGCWFYEPELTSHSAFVEYLRNGWPGTAVAIDTEHGEPQLVELLADLNPLNGGPGIGDAGVDP